MLNVLICEDDSMYRAELKTTIDSYAKHNNLLISMPICTASPHDIINQLKQPQLNNSVGLYFVDIDLKCDLNGFSLATQIRQHDPRAFIVIVTVDPHSQMLAFKHGIEIMDYIIKGSDMHKERIHACVKYAYDRFIAHKKTENTPDGHFQIKLAENARENGTRIYSKGCVVNLDLNDILYVESSDRPHFICIHTRKSKYITRMRIKDALKLLGPTFLRCGSSYVVNMAKVAAIEHAENKLVLDNGNYIYITRNALRHAVKFKEHSF